VWSYNKNERELIRKTRAYIKYIFGLDAYIINQETSTQVVIGSNRLGKFFKQFGDRANMKKVPPWILELPKEKLTYILKGYIQGDGHVNKRRVEASSTSPSLAFAIFLISAKVGNLPSIRQEKAKESNIKERIIKGTSFWRVYWAKRKQKGKRLRHGIAYPLRKIHIENYDGYVYNLELNPEHSYTANLIAVSNCTHLGQSCRDLSRIYNRKIAGPPVRFQSAKYVVDHIKYLRLKYCIDFVSILDENFLANRKRCLEFADLMEQEGLAGLVKFGVLGHPRTITTSIVRRLRDVGLDYVSMGGESGSQKLLDNVKRTHTVEQTQKAIENIIKAGVNPIATFMTGFPNETVEDILATVEFWKRNQIEIRPFFITPYPGTELFIQNRQRILKQFDGNLEKFVLALGDAVDLVANISPWDDATLLGLRELMASKDVKRIKRWAKERGLLKNA